MRCAVVATIALLSVPALAQDRPPLQPTRDVTVTYAFSGARAQEAGAPTISMAYQAASQMRRSDIGALGYMVLDQRNGRAFMVMEAQRMIMDIPAAQATRMQGIPENASFTRGGTATVAGLRCNLWTVRSPEGEGTSCITDDGVMLRVEGTFQGRTGGMEATQVNYGAIDPARFQRPQGYQSMQIPGQMPGAAPAQPRR